LSGELLVELSAERSLTVSELKRRIAAESKLLKGSVVELASSDSGAHLEDEQTLQVLGEADGLELLASCSNRIEGVFEKYVQGCPSGCGLGDELQRLCFSEDGTVSVQKEVSKEARKYRYSVIDSREGRDGLIIVFSMTQLPRKGTDDNFSNGASYRVLDLPQVMEYMGAVMEEEEKEGESHTYSSIVPKYIQQYHSGEKDEEEDDPNTYTGVLYHKFGSAINRRVEIRALGIAVEDVRLLKQRSLQMQRDRLEMFWKRSPYDDDDNDWEMMIPYDDWEDLVDRIDNDAQAFRVGKVKTGKPTHNRSRPRQEQSCARKSAHGSETAMLRAILMKHALQKKRGAYETRVRRRERNLRWS
jgi:hypothetical protein